MSGRDVASRWGGRAVARVVAWFTLLLAAFLSTSGVRAAEALSDEQLASVEGRDGIGMAVHLELNSALLAGATMDSRITMGFKSAGVNTYLVIQNFGGVMDQIGMSLQAKTRTDGGGDYLDFTLPVFVGFKDFGFRAMSAQTDPSAPITSSYGQILMNGTAQVQGHVLLWAH
ncbi:hypothetical protein [Aquabacterium sp.]|uniref:hypothetical protein n=1 Tax=Aquabacterium sp. TaxID=1872578 RepID=UPI0035AE581C